MCAINLHSSLCKEEPQNMMRLLLCNKQIDYLKIYKKEVKYKINTKGQV